MLELKTFIHQDQVVFGLRPGTREEIIRQLAEPLIQKKLVSDPDQFINDVLKREDQISTVMENQTAFPHARSSAVSRLTLSVGMVLDPAGIQFGPEGTAPTRTFFLVAVPAYAPTAHLPLLQQLASFAHDPQRIEKFIRQKSAGLAARMLCAFHPKK